MAKKTKDFAAVIRAKLASNSELAEAVESERFTADVAGALIQARSEAGLTQLQLADNCGMQQPAIARMENSDYDGHTLSSLKRIACALGKRLSVQFLPASAGDGVIAKTATAQVDIQWCETTNWHPSIHQPVLSLVA